MDMDEKDQDDMEPKRTMEQADTEKHPRVQEEKHRWGDEEFSFDSIWDRLPHISLYQVRVKTRIWSHFIHLICIFLSLLSE